MNVELTRIAAIKPPDVDAMFSLMDRHFENVSRPLFEQDLAAKDWAMLVKEDDDVIGFTTIRLCSAALSTGDALVVYSGDTLVHPRSRMSTAFVRGWFASVRHLQASAPQQNLYWFLLCSGFRTYRFMPVYWKTFYPRYDQPTPAPWKEDMDLLADRMFGRDYDSGRGIVKMKHPQVLRDAHRDIPSGRHRDPRIRFFVQRNPGHAGGDELVCLTAVREDNLTATGRRYWSRNNLVFRVVNEPD